MTKHTAEPWFIGSGSHVCGALAGMIRVESPEDFHSNGIDYPDGSTKSYTNVVCGTTGHSDTARANILRIVSCVNALADIPDPAAFVARAKRMEADRAALLAVVRECARADSDCCGAIRSLARSALNPGGAA